MTDSNNLCMSLTKDRRPCNDRRFGWSHFCWYHQPWPEIGLATVISLLVGVNAVWFIGLRSAQWTRAIAGSFEDSKDETAYLAQNLQGYDMNADSSAIEVVDSESRPVLQFARDEGGLVGWIVTRQKSGDERQPRIFQYPGDLHPGVRDR